MKNYLFFLVTLVVALFSANAMAYTPPPAPANGWYVVDQTGKLTDGQQRLLNQKIERISKSTKNEFGILLLPNMGGENIEDVANATYKGWGIGKHGLDNGCLIVVAIKERKSRIETGKGVGGEVSDLQANDILKKNLNPHLKSGDFYGGFDATLDGLSTLMESRINQKADPPPVTRASDPAPTTQPQTTSQRSPSCQVSNVGESTSGGTWVVLLLLGVGVSIAIFVARSVRRRQEEDERERQLAAQRRLDRAEKIRAEQARIAREQRERDRQKEEACLASAATATPKPEPVVVVRPAIEPHSVFPVPRTVPRPTLKTSHVKPRESTHAADALAAGAAALAAAEAAHEATLQRERAERDAAEHRRRQRERDDEDRRRRDREDDDRRRRDSESSSSSSSSSSWDSGSSSGGGFGGGDSGGGGSSSDW